MPAPGEAAPAEAAPGESAPATRSMLFGLAVTVGFALLVTAVIVLLMVGPTLFCGCGTRPAPGY